MPEQLKLVYSAKNEIRPGKHYLKCDSLRIKSSLSPQTPLRDKIARLEAESPAAAQIVEELVTEILKRIQKQ